MTHRYSWSCLENCSTLSDSHSTGYSETFIVPAEQLQSGVVRQLVARCNCSRCWAKSAIHAVDKSGRILVSAPSGKVHVEGEHPGLKIKHVLVGFRVLWSSHVAHANPLPRTSIYLHPKTRPITGYITQFPKPTHPGKSKANAHACTCGIVSFMTWPIQLKVSNFRSKGVPMWSRIRGQQGEFVKHTSSIPKTGKSLTRVRATCNA